MPFEPGPWDVNLHDYHADRECVSHSSLEAFRYDAGYYHGVYFREPVSARIVVKETEALLIGNAVDCLVFEPDDFKNRFFNVGKINRRTTEGKALYATEINSAPNKRPLDSDQWVQVHNMAKSVLGQPIVRLALENARPQHSIRWVDPDTGVALKARFDLLHNCGIAIDLKSSREPTPDVFPRQANEYGYHRQAALYREGRYHVFGIPREEEFLHVVVGNADPYTCVVYQMDEDTLALGHSQNQEDLARLARCRQSGDWTNEWQRGRQTLRLPAYAFPRRSKFDGL